ncbi:MAG TPA: ABC transporter ATP-binding protein, partial [Dehalococcoidia bacterium]|nr:ABC transporter ATP-binding protein [Dehalococcoidia bacterium]
SMAEVILRQLAKRFGSAVAVDSIDLVIQHGQFVCLLGPSGCGKTTTLRLVAGFITPSDGEVLVGGKVVSSPARVVPPERRDMSMIFQSYAVWPHKTVADNVAFGLECRKVPKSERRERVLKALDIVQMRELANRYPTQLSGGQQQRVALARALVIEPAILLLDEPLSNLDAALREEMRFEIRQIHERFGITTIYVTHDQAEAMVVADQIAVMNLGKIEHLAPPKEIYERPRTEFVARFIGLSNIIEGRLDPAGEILECAGFALRIAWPERFRGGETQSICIRPHEITMYPADQAISKGDGNVLHGRITRQAYLGDSRHYLVTVDGGVPPIRVITRATEHFTIGDSVTLELPPEDCRPLAPSPAGAAIPPTNAGEAAA